MLINFLKNFFYHRLFPVILQYHSQKSIYCMETIYIALIGFLFLLAISDLIVGVSNDAVNFLNSAVGSKAAPFKMTIVIAALGILIGTTFSSGMMEVARKGIFNPQMFFFSEIMIIFLAVMLTDVILLDMFNTFGLPTSTTVSIVFELLGASVAIAMLKVKGNHIEGKEIIDYINSGKALAIISGILLSVVISFSMGAFVQYITRLIFSFDYKKNFKYLGAIWGGIAITAITYFILIKGAKGASFISDETLLFIKNNSFLIILYSFIGWTILLQLLRWVAKLNILKFIVLVGTFALAMAFAGNDLVNFIGVPLAGFEAYKNFAANPGIEPNAFLMGSLQNNVYTPTLYLLIAGIIMVITLWFSKKAKNVTKTEIDLGRQYEGEERFGSTIVSRSLVGFTRNIGKIINIIIPDKIQQTLNKQFAKSKAPKFNEKNAPSFDMLRASVNLVVASILIAFATSLKLPLSTTYVTFMVAMGTSLADRAWGRESAVYRITGVISVIGGWFFTAFLAFTGAFVFALLFSWGKIYTIVLMAIVALIVIFRTHVLHKKKENEKIILEEKMEIDESNVVDRCNLAVSLTISKINTFYKEIIEGISKENLKQLKQVRKEIKDLNKEAKLMKDNIGLTISKIKDDSVETGHYYVQVVDYLREIAHNMSFIVNPCYIHIENHHKGLTNAQVKELKKLQTDLNILLTDIRNIVISNEFKKITVLISKQQEIIDHLELIKKNQIKRIKREEVGTKNSLLFFTITNETKNLALNAINLLKSERDFSLFNAKRNKH